MKYCILIIFLLASYTALCQRDTVDVIVTPFDTVYVETFSIPSPSDGDRMEYRYPKEVCNAIMKSIENMPNSDFLIIQDFDRDTVVLSLQSFPKNAQAKSDLQKLIKSTNRYINIRETKISVAFESDFLYSFPSFHFTDALQVFKFNKVAWYSSVKYLLIE